MTTSPIPLTPLPYALGDVATLLRRYRRAHGLTQEALAERAGISVGAISYLERGLTQSPHRDTLRALATALSLSSRELSALEEAARPIPRDAAHMQVTAIDADQDALPFGDSPIPEPLTSLIGRERESDAIVALLAREDVRILTLTGPAGVGKTRLATHVATRERNSRRQAVVFVDLTTVQSPEDVLPAIAQALKVRDTGAQPLCDTLAAALMRHDVLLALDNFEQVATAARALVDLLRACPGVKALVTSRIPLKVRGEYEFSVSPLTIPEPSGSAEQDDLEAYTAIALFCDRARAIRPDFAVSGPEDSRRMAEMCARLDGLPLAIELAATHIRHASLAELHARLMGDSPLNMLVGGPRDLPSHQRAMRSTIAWSYRLLSAEEQRVFRALSVFAGGATAEGMAAVIGTDEPALVHQLDALVDQHLAYVTTTRDGAPARYNQLVTLCAYALERLEESGELAAAAHRHAEFYTALAEAHRLRLARCDPASMALLDEEYENVRRALCWALETADATAVEIGLRLVGMLWYWWEIRGFWVEGLDWLERLIPSAPEVNDDAGRAVLAAVWTGVMALSCRLGRFERAYEAGENALALRCQLSDKGELAEAFNNQGVVASTMRLHAIAEAHFRAALALYEEMGHPVEEFTPLLNLGEMRRDQRQHAEALSLYRESLRIAERTSDYDEARAILWENIADIHILLGEPDQAIPAIQRGEALFRGLDSAWGVALAAHDLGRACAAQRRFAEAARHLSLAITMRDRVGDSAGAARSRAYLARLRLARADTRSAMALLGEALQMVAALRQTAALWPVVEAGADLACALARVEDAARLYVVAIAQRDALWDIIDPYEYERRAEDIATIRETLGEDLYATLCATGATMTPDEALDLLRAQLGARSR